MKRDNIKVILPILILILLIVVGAVMFNKPKSENNETTTDEVFSLANIKSVPKKLDVKDAVNKGYFVYDGQADKVYNKGILDRFVQNTKANAENRINDEIIIVIYNIDGEPGIYNICYNAETNRYFYAYDYTRITIWEGSDEEKLNNWMYTDIISTDEILGKYYELEVEEDTEFRAGIIKFKVYNNTDENTYRDFEVARYMLDAEIVNE